MKKKRNNLSISYKLNRFIYSYRYDLFSMSFMILLIFWYVSPLFDKGHIVFSDIDFPLDSRRYMEEILGLWNQRWSTGTLLNLPRLAYILPSWLLSALAGYKGSLFFKAFLMQILLTAAVSQYIFTRKLIRVYHREKIEFPHTLILIPGALFYALNPWVIYRIQHIYLLCGYSLFPLLLLFFFNTFDPRFLKQNIRDYSPFHNRLYRRNLIDAAGLGLILSTLSAGIHYFFYSIILLFIFYLILLGKTCYRHRGAGALRIRGIMGIFFLKGLAFSGFFLLFSFHWLSVYAAGILSGKRPSQFNINVIDTLNLFSSNSSLKNVLYLNSYWWPMFSLESLPLSFHIAGGVLLTVVLIGIIFKSWKHGILLFLSLLMVTLVFLGTGVKLDRTADFFIFFVTSVPVIGPMFRDPDKLVGILALSYSTLFTFGLMSLGQFLTRDNRRQMIIRFTLAGAILFALFMYLSPYRKHFIEGFYAPVAVPDEYSDLNRRFLEEGSAGRVLYIPTADNMIQSFSGVATPFWNINPQEGGYVKPTGDFHVYNSLKDTVFHHEGSIPEISYYMKYLQYLLDRGLSTNILRYATVFSADEIIYHREYTGQEARQDFNLALMEEQLGIRSRESLGLFTSYRPDSVPDRTRIVPRRIFTPYGLSQLEAYSAMEGFNWKNYGIIFSAQNRGSFLNVLQKGDLFETKSLNDLMLSSLDHKYYLNPFDFINDGNPYLKWAKTRLSTPDWMWYLQSQGIKSNSFDFDLGVGVGVSYSSSRLDLPPHRMSKAEGDLLIDFNSLLRIEKFFTPDNPHLFSAQANPISPYNNLPVLHGEIRKGESENIWQVAKSGMLRVTGDTPYQFRISLSGRGTNKMHVKVRFFDTHMNELGVTYVIAPSEEISFDGMTLYGEYVSPSESRFMRIDLLSYQRPEQKVFWWIHDIRILDLKKYRSPNTIDMTRYADKDESVHLYLRAFRSPRGGNMTLRLNDRTTLSVETLSSGSGMEWFDLGLIKLEKGLNTISIENRSGFNAVNTLALIPEEEYERLAFPLKRVSDRGLQFFTAEAESDFIYSGNIQTDRSYPALHSGKGIRSVSGSLTMDFEVLQDGFYDWTLFSSFPGESSGRINLTLLDKEEQSVFKKSFGLQDLKGSSLRTGEVVFDPLLYKDFPRRLTDPGYELKHYGTLSESGIPLGEGKYTLEISLDSALESMATVDDISLFDPSEVRTAYFLEDTFQQNCSDCTHLSEEMSSLEIQDSILTISYDASCSCDWYVYSTDKLDVRKGREYWIGFTARSENLVNRHMKILFLNEKDEIVGSEYISEVEEIYKENFNSYEQIFTIPEKALRMVFQIWGRGNPSAGSTFQIKDLMILPLDEMLLVDSVRMKESSRSQIPGHQDEYLAVTSESFSNQWRVGVPTVTDRSVPVNSVSTGFIVKEEKVPAFSLLFSHLYRIGLFLFPAGLILVLILIRKKR